MAGSAAEHAALLGLGLKRLRQMAVSYGSREYSGGSLSLNEQSEHNRRAQAAREIVEQLEAERLERLASDQLKGLVCSDFASMDHDGMAQTAVSLARSLIAALDET